MTDIVIHCPCKVHEKPQIKMDCGERIERIPNPKILFIASPESTGDFKIQCGDHRCVSEGQNRGWYKITLNGCGGYKVQPVSQRELQERFKLEKVPYALQDGD